MWLRNYDLLTLGDNAYMYPNATSIPTVEGKTYGEEGCTLAKDSYGNLVKVGSAPDRAGVLSRILWSGNTTSDSSPAGIVLGTGTTPPTYDDYKIESFANLTINSNSFTSNVEYNTDKKKWICTGSVDFQNMTGETLTITEMAVAVQKQGTSWSYSKYFYIYRALLPEPKTVANGEYINITFSYELDGFPNATVTAE